MKLLLKNCDILAADGDGYRWLKSAYLGIDGSVIDYIGESRPQADYEREKDMSGRLLAPGLINCHGHTAMTLLRGVGSDLPLQEWLFEKMMPIEDKFTARDIQVGNALALLEMISTGTTSRTASSSHRMYKLLAFTRLCSHREASSRGSSTADTVADSQTTRKNRVSIYMPPFSSSSSR